MRVAGQSEFAILRLAVAPNAQHAIGMVGENLLARMVPKLRGQRNRPADTPDLSPMPVEDFAVPAGDPTHQFVGAVAIQVYGKGLVDAERQRDWCGGTQVEGEFVPVMVEATVRAASLVAD